MAFFVFFNINNFLHHLYRKGSALINAQAAFSILINQEGAP